MDLRFTAADEAFRQEIRTFMRDHLPPEIATDIRRWYNPRPEYYRRWQRILADKGWGAPHWPVRWGGTDWSPLRKHIFFEELYRADAPDFGWQATHMLAPVLFQFGTEAQCARFAPKILTGEEFWCQGFSEPSAGSDLANLKTTAERVGDEWVIRGQKIWTSDAEYSDWGFFLVRTDATVKPQRGLSMIMVRMNTPGITVRPIHSIDGRHDLTEVFLDEVRVPDGQLIGEPGKGWTYAKYLLDKERTASAFLYFNRRRFNQAVEIAQQTIVGGKPLIEDRAFARKLARVEADLDALYWSVLRILAEENNKYEMNAVVSALKIRGSELQQRVTALQIEALGPLGLRYFERDAFEAQGEQLMRHWPDFSIGAMSLFLFERAATIYGGAREVQKNIIAKLAFGF
jgi:alkylation response protein AidB-like acyl-CoA dehydrogenase